MADPKVKLTFVGESEQARREVDKLQAKFERLEQNVKNAGRRQKQQSAGVVGSLTKWATGLVTIQAAYGAIQRTIGAVAAENRRLADGVSETTRKLAEEELKLQIQGGLTPSGLEKRLPQIKKSLLETPSTDLAGGLQISTQLVSSGFAQQDVESGAALRTVLELKAATNQFGKSMGDVKESVQATSQFLKAIGFDSPSAANIRSTGGKLTQLFEGSDIQFRDLSPLAVQAAGLKAMGISENQQLATFSAGVDVLGGEQGATAFQQTAVGLRAAGTTPKGTKALASIGLTPEDVDFIGEDFPTALKTLKTALAGVDEKTASDAVINIFGKQAAKATQTLLGKTDVIDQRLGILEGDAFDRNVGIFQQSRFAAQQRELIRREFAERTLGAQGTTFGEAEDILNRRQAEGAVGASLPRRIGNAADTAASRAGLGLGKSIGLTAEESEARATPAVSGIGKSLVAGMVNPFLVVPVLLNELLDTNKDQLKETRKRSGGRNAHRE